MIITGGCRCGSVRYRIEASCPSRAIAGAATANISARGSGTVNVFLASDKVRIKDALTDYMSHADSGTLMPTGRSAQPTARRCSPKPTRANTISAGSGAKPLGF